MSNGFGNGRHPPGDEDPLRELREIVDSVRKRFGGGGGGKEGGGLSPWPILIVVLVVYLASGVFIVGPDERGVVLRFGKVVREVGPGPGYHLPWPIEEALTPSVTQIRKDEFGFRTVDLGPPARYRSVPQEALMLTGDGNIVKLEFIVQYRVKPDRATDFLFNVRDPRATLRVASEAAMRQVIGGNKIDDALTDERERIQQESKESIQAILDDYESGIEVVAVQLQDVQPPDEVSDAFKDVISAEQDKERMINEARGYANDVVPKARGEAAQRVNQADGYRQAQIQKATGESERFLALYEEYSKAQSITRRRMYLEAMEEILPDVETILVDESARQVVPYLPLGRAGRIAPAPAASGGAEVP